MLVLYYLFLIPITLFVLLALLRTYQTQHKFLQKDFLKGTIPNPLPNGPYKGGVANLKVTWQGKSFDAKNNTGINKFKVGDKEVEKYPFKTYVAKGLQDNIDVIKIDYNIRQNPWWLRIVLDEIVKTGEDEFLGKVHMRLIPGLPFSLGYFTLKK